MMRPLWSMLLVFQIVFSVNFPAIADETRPLSEYLRGDANVVAVLRTAQMRRSARAVREKWAQNPHVDPISGASDIPYWVDVAWLAAQAYPGRTEKEWTTAVVTLPLGSDFATLIETEDSEIQTLAGKRAIQSSRDAYFVELNSQVLGVMTPALRQEAARWVHSIDEGHIAPLSEYLQSASRSEKHVVIALDMADMLDPILLRWRFESAAALRGKQSEIDAYVELFSGLQGVRFEAQVDDDIQAALRIDFSSDVGAAGNDIKSLFLEWLADEKAALDEFETCDMRTAGSAVIFEMELSDSSLQRILSLVLPPPPSRQESQATTTTTQADRPATTKRPTRTSSPLDASKSYYAAVNRIIEDLQRANRRAKNYSNTATWHDNFARKIDNLPLRGVDRELADYGAGVSSNLRALAASLRGVAVEVNAGNRSVTYDVQYNPGYAAVSIWGGVGYRNPSRRVTSNLQDVREKQAAAVTAGSKERQQIWQIIQDDQNRIRRRMLDKYGVDFDERSGRSRR